MIYKLIDQINCYTMQIINLLIILKITIHCNSIINVAKLIDLWYHGIKVLIIINNWICLLFFQADASKIGILHVQILKLLRKFLGKVVKAKVIASYWNISDLHHHIPDNQLLNYVLVVGPCDREYSSNSSYVTAKVSCIRCDNNDVHFVLNQYA